MLHASLDPRRHEIVVADDLDSLADGARERDQTGFVVFRERVFDRYDWIFVDPAHELLAQGVRFEFLLLERKSIPPIAAELDERSRAIETSSPGTSLARSIAWTRTSRANLGTT
jgi:hypothetical protein